MDSTARPPLPDADAVAETVTPVTAPTQAAETATPKPPARLEPTRYGDWELNGKCVDF